MGIPWELLYTTGRTVCDAKTHIHGKMCRFLRFVCICFLAVIYHFHAAISLVSLVYSEPHMQSDTGVWLLLSNNLCVSFPRCSSLQRLRREWQTTLFDTEIDSSLQVSSLPHSSWKSILSPSTVTRSVTQFVSQSSFCGKSQGLLLRTHRDAATFPFFFVKRTQTWQRKVQSTTSILCQFWEEGHEMKRSLTKESFSKKKTTKSMLFLVNTWIWRRVSLPPQTSCPVSSSSSLYTPGKNNKRETSSLSFHFQEFMIGQKDRSKRAFTMSLQS